MGFHLSSTVPSPRHLAEKLTLGPNRQPLAEDELLELLELIATVVELLSTVLELLATVLELLATALELLATVPESPQTSTV